MHLPVVVLGAVAECSQGLGREQPAFLPAKLMAFCTDSWLLYTAATAKGASECAEGDFLHCAHWNGKSAT